MPVAAIQPTAAMIITPKQAVKMNNQSEQQRWSKFITAPFPQTYLKGGRLEPSAALFANGLMLPAGRHLADRLLRSARTQEVVSTCFDATLHQAGMTAADRAIDSNTGRDMRLGGITGQAAPLGIIDEILHILFYTLFAVAAAVGNHILLCRFHWMRKK
ncbi:hypothetical protein VU07_03335 [Desulfobulbus sp. F4]|nr:hypothetical protein [Desulfobulbus sp. F4]